MEAGEIALFALLPYRITAITAGTDKSVYEPGEAVEITAALENAAGTIGRHVVRIDLFDPDGNVVPHYSQSVDAKDGGATGTIQLALNEILGAWTIRVKDVVSGVTASAEFKVE